jgi:hypothetical protein
MAPEVLRKEKGAVTSAVVHKLNLGYLGTGSYTLYDVGWVVTF